MAQATISHALAHLPTILRIKQVKHEAVTSSYKHIAIDDNTFFFVNLYYVAMSCF
jgi:hypothetical protein